MSTLPRPHLVSEAEPEIGWPEYPRIEPGDYLAYCNTARVYHDPAFRRWTCLLRFDVLSNDMHVLAKVPMWLNLGDGPKAHAPRRSRYLEEWVKARGAPPVRSDRLSPNVFTRRLAKVHVGDNNSVVPYSVVKKILRWETGAGPPSQPIK